MWNPGSKPFCACTGLFDLLFLESKKLSAIVKQQNIRIEKFDNTDNFLTITFLS
jgi:hypothetical protein